MTIIGLVKEIEAGHYVFLRDRHMHWGWSSSMTLHTLSGLARGGRFYKAIKNKSLIDQIPNSIEFLNNQKEN